MNNGVSIESTGKRWNLGALDWSKILSTLVGITIIVAILAPLVPLVIWSFGSSWFFPDLLPSKVSMRAWNNTC